MWLDEYNKKIALMNTTNNNDYYIKLDSYLDFIINSHNDQLKQMVLIKIENKLNILNDPILEKLRIYSMICAIYSFQNTFS